MAVGNWWLEVEGYRNQLIECQGAVETSYHGVSYKIKSL
jgi:hypothetical protein